MPTAWTPGKQPDGVNLTYVPRFDTYVSVIGGERNTEVMAADRRAGRIPHVGKQPRARTQSGAWRKKRSDAGKRRKGASKGLFTRLFG